MPEIDAGHVQVSPSEIVFDETNWNQPQTIRVLVLEDLFLPGDSAELQITHTTRTLDQHYKRSILAPRSVSLPSICGDGRCLGEETYASCALDCRNAGTTAFCGDGLCHEETWQSCPEDCSVQGSDNTCPHDRPVRCRSGECTHQPAHCAMRSRSTSQSCDSDTMCEGAVLACKAPHVLCPDGSCAEAAYQCESLEPCPPGLKRCFDTSCQAECGVETNRCPPARRNLDLLDRLCRGDPDHHADVAIEDADRDAAVLSTIHRPLHSTSRIWFLASNGQKYYGQLAFPGGAFDGAAETTCPCNELPINATALDPMISVKVVVVDDAELPEGAFGGFELTLPEGTSSFLPHVAQVWLSHKRTDIDEYCLGADTGAGWICLDESLQTSSKDASCACEIKHTRGTFSSNWGRFALIRDNCPGIDNPMQADSDRDGIGNECDPCPYSHGDDCSIGCDGGDINKDYVDEIFKELNIKNKGSSCPTSPYI